MDDSPILLRHVRELVRLDQGAAAN